MSDYLESLKNENTQLQAEVVLKEKIIQTQVKQVGC